MIPPPAPSKGGYLISLSLNKEREGNHAMREEG